MKTTKITIKNLFGIRETTLDGKSVEISGPKGSGKTSVLDAIRYYDVPRFSENAAVGWKAGKINDR